MTDSEIIENDFLQKAVESLNQNIEKLTEEIAELKEKLHKDSTNHPSRLQATATASRNQKV